MNKYEMNECLTAMGISPSDIILSDAFLKNLSTVVRIRCRKGERDAEQWRLRYSSALLGKRTDQKRAAMEYGNTAYYMTALNILSSDIYS